MGRCALKMNSLLSGVLTGHEGRTMHWHPESTTSTGMAVDGFHPSSQGYAEWAAGLSQRTLAAGV
jgi:lysophospholipase L1-like esterase